MTYNVFGGTLNLAQLHFSPRGVAHVAFVRARVAGEIGGYV